MDIEFFLFAINFLTTLSFGRGGPMEPRIVGGARAFIGAYPYVVSLQIVNEERKVVKCTGSIISEYWVLTAAHCYRGTGSKPNATRVIAATLNYAMAQPETQERRSVEIIVHDTVSNRQHFEMDITLIKVDKPFVFDDTTKPIQLAKSPFPSGVLLNCTSIGYGRIDDAGKLQNTGLYSLPTRGGDFEFCRKLKPTLEAEEEFLCLDTNKNGSSTCSGDSGGPLVCNGVLSGVLSGKTHVATGKANGQCSGTSAVSVYMFVGFFEDWIRQHVPELPEFVPVLKTSLGPSSRSGVKP